MSTARFPVLVGLCWLLALGVARPSQAGPAAPELPDKAQSQWLNSAPLQLADLRGRPVLLTFWTYNCHSSRRSIPWLKAMQQRHAERLHIIGVHTPEHLDERAPASVARKLKDFEIRFPVLLDNDFRYWNAIGNRYWPSFYLVDGQGRIAGAWAGEITVGSGRADQVERAIAELLEKATTANRP